MKNDFQRDIPERYSGNDTARPSESGDGDEDGKGDGDRDGTGDVDGDGTGDGDGDGFANKPTHLGSSAVQLQRPEISLSKEVMTQTPRQLRVPL